MYVVLLSTAGPSRWPVPTPLYGERPRACGSLAKSLGGNRVVPRWQRGGGRGLAAAVLSRGVLGSSGRGGSEALCGVAVTMALRASSSENSTWSVGETELERLCLAERGSLAGRYLVPAVHLHTD